MSAGFNKSLRTVGEKGEAGGTYVVRRSVDVVLQGGVADHVAVVNLTSSFISRREGERKRE